MNLKETTCWALRERIKAESLKPDVQTPYRLGYIQALKDILSIMEK